MTAHREPPHITPEALMQIVERALTTGGRAIEQSIERRLRFT
jgi:hypothetical protein